MKKLSLLATLALAAAAQAQTWTGNLSNDFNAAGNWSAALGTNSTLQINGPGTQGNLTLVNVGYTFTGTGGKIGIGDNSGAMVLTGGTLNFFNGTVDAIGVGINNSSTVTIASDSILGNGTASTISFTSRNATTGLLRVTGNVTGGTGGTPAALVFSLGSTSGNNGNYEFTGNLNRGGALSMQLTKRGNGTATLTGTNVFVNLGNNEAGSTIRINGGQTNILNAAGGGYGVTNQGTSVIRVSAGELNAFDSRNVRNSILVDGGTFNMGQAYNESGVLQTNNGTTGARFSFNAGSGSAPAYTFTISSGNVTFLPAGGVNNFGVRFGSDSGPGVSGNETNEATVAASQTGGTFIVNGRGGQDVTFSLGTATANKTNSYALSGGVLDVRGSDSTNGAISLGANATTGSAVLTLSGTGKLISRSNPATVNAGISGKNAGAAQVLDLQGGTLVAGRIDATNLRGSLLGTNGNIVNNGSTIAPGDIGTAGRTNIQGGNLTLTSGTMLLDIFGTTAATTFQDVTPGRFDNVLVSGVLNYGGTLSLNFGAFTPTVGNSFNLFDFSSFTGTFASIIYSDPGITGTFDYTTGVLTIDAVPEPSTYALLAIGLGGLLALRRRKRA